MVRRPEAFTRTAHRGIPGVELIQLNPMIPRDAEAYIAALDKIEPITLVRHARLDWRWRRDSISICRRSNLARGR